MTAPSDKRWLPTEVEVDPEPDTSLSEFFTPAFMRRYTRFESFDAFVEASRWSMEDFRESDGPPQGELDRYVTRTTEFDHWTAMRNRAAEREVHQRHLY